MSEYAEVIKSNAIKHWMSRTVIPLLYDDPSGRLDSYGSGILIRSNGNVIFVTARHNLFFNDRTTRRDFSRLAIPIPDRSAPEKKDVVNTLGEFDLLAPQDPPDHEIDIALLHLKDVDIIRKSCKSWTVVDRSKAAIASPQGNFILAGYPSEKVRVTRQGLGGSLNLIYTKRMLQVPQGANAPVNQDYDLFFNCTTNADDLTSNVVKTSSVSGMSGSVVWELLDTHNEIWAPDKALTMVAIQVSWMKGNFVRAKSWTYVECILNRSGL